MPPGADSFSDYGWRAVKVETVRLRVPVGYETRRHDNLTLFFPAGTTDGLPWIGIATLPVAPEMITADQLLERLQPAPSDEETNVRPAEALIAGVAVRGWQTRKDGVRGWTYVLRRGTRPRGLLLIAVPLAWADDRAWAFHDTVVAGVTY